MNEEWWRANARSVKGSLTRAEKIVKTDAGRALMTADDVFALMEEHGYPDWWSRVQRLKIDCQFQLRSWS